MSGEGALCARANDVATKPRVSSLAHFQLFGPTSRNPPQRVSRILGFMILAQSHLSEPRKWDGLLLHDGLHQVSWPVDVDSVLERHVVGEHLERDDLRDG